ncbi:MAG TPA: group III truncated hemoglobin [Gemmatimonadaceae bacterium]|jgi:hemoglobin
MHAPIDVATTAGLPDLRDADLHDLLVSFYTRIESDSILRAYFADLDVTAHMPRIVAFWSTLLFHTARYSGNAFLPHQRMRALRAEHFAHWVGTLESIIDARFAGPHADLMKAFAHRIAYSMQLRLGIEPFAAFQSVR